MGHVRSRKFCCCLPVRFGVFCSALIGLMAGGAFGGLGWYEVHEWVTNQITLDTEEKVVLILFSVTYTIMALLAFFGLVGSLAGSRALVHEYAVSVTVSTVTSIGVGIYFIYRLFFHDMASCTTTQTTDTAEVVSYVCRKGFEVIRIVIVVFLVIVWLFQIAGCFIVYDYVGQLNEESALEFDSERERIRTNPAPVGVSNGPAMRTTYDSAPYQQPEGVMTASQPDPIMKSAQPGGEYPFTGQANNQYARDY